MRTKIAILFLIMPSVLFADPEFGAAALPRAGSGVTIIPADKMPISESMKKEVALHLLQQKTKGYFDSESTYPRTLLKMNNTHLIESNKNSDPYDTHMKYSLSQVRLAFKFKEIPGINAKNRIGFAVGGMFINKSGWTGIAEFFNDNEMGVCKYNIDNMYLTKGAVQISSESVRYDVNKKPGDVFVEGSVNSGFIYTVSWFDKTFSHSLECANMNFSHDIIPKMINLAIKIDKSIS